VCTMLLSLATAQADQPHPSALSQLDTAMKHDLFDVDYSPTDCPDWAKEDLPRWLLPHVGKNGAPAEYRDKAGPFSTNVRGIDRYQANWFIMHNPQTAQFIYEQYTPQQVGYVPGTLPGYERISQKYTAGLSSDTDKAIALLMALPELVRHPSMPPLGPSTRSDRNLDDEALLASGQGWCNEQARVFIRLCQVNNIPARMIHLFGQNHTIAEFYADGRWALADASIFFVARGKDGKLLSAAQCHDQGEGQRAYALAKQAAMRKLAELPDAELGRTPEQAERYRQSAANFDAERLATRTDLVFGVINYPLPVTSAASHAPAAQATAP
jgi:hypothetical protein